MIHRTANELWCLPMYSNKEAHNLSPIKCIEIAGISDVKWPGITPRTGDPLQMKVSAQRRSFIELLQPAHDRTESRIISIGFTTGGEYTRLIRLLVYVEHQTIIGAFWVYGQPYLPRIDWRPKPGPWKPYYVAKSNIDKKTHM